MNNIFLKGMDVSSEKTFSLMREYLDKESIEIKKNIESTYLPKGKTYEELEEELFSTKARFFELMIKEVEYKNKISELRGDLDSLNLSSALKRSRLESEVLLHKHLAWDYEKKWIREKSRTFFDYLFGR